MDLSANHRDWPTAGPLFTGHFMAALGECGSFHCLPVIGRGKLSLCVPWSPSHKRGGAGQVNVRGGGGEDVGVRWGFVG